MTKEKFERDYNVNLDKVAMHPICNGVAKESEKTFHGFQIMWDEFWGWCLVRYGSVCHWKENLKKFEESEE